MAARRVHHWKHGWIPLDMAAALKKNHGDHAAASRELAHHAFNNARKASTADTLIHSIKANGGFTYDPRAGRLLEVGKDSGFAVARQHTEQDLGNGDIGRDEFARAAAAVVKKHAADIANGSVLGGWYSEDRDKYMVELTDIHPATDREGAIALGKARNQEAIFDLSTGDTIPTGGTGGGGE